MDVISINSDSEDEAVPPPKAAPTTIQTAATHSSSESATILCEPSSSAMQALTLSSASPTLSSHSQSQLQAQAEPPATSNMDFVRRRRKVTMKEIRVETHFPVIKEVNMEFRAIFGVNYSQSKVMKIIQSYIRCLRALQEVVHKYPNKCGLLSKNVSRSMLLLRGLSKHFADTPYYLQKICELLAIYTFLELRFATAFTDSKIRIAERIITNINLHMESVDFSYVLRIFAYIPYMGKESEIVSAIFQKLIPEPLVLVKNEFNDRLYIQYLIAFYHWKDAEAHYDDQQKVIAFASRFMKPKHSLKSSLIYARHLPSYVKREDATSYFLNNLVFFNDLRTASLLDGVAANLPSMIDLSDDLETLPIDYAEVSEDQPIAAAPTIKLEEQQIVATVDLTDIDDDAPWLTRLVRRAVETEVKLPRIMTAAQDEMSVIDLDSSDDEAWVFDRNDGNAKKNTCSAQITTDSNDSFRNIFNQLNTSVDLPDDSTSDALLKELTQNVGKRVVAAEESTQSQTSTAKETRITFEGITENELNSLPITSTANPGTEANIAVPLFGEDEFHEVPTTAAKTNHSSVVETILKDFSDMPSASEPSEEVCENVLEESNAQRDAVTLNTLNLETFPNCNESSEEYGEACLTNDNNSPLKTYLKKFFKTPETNVSINLFENVVDESEKSSAKDPSNCKETRKAICLPEESKKKTPNVVFSGKVISLREDENIGGLTPSYLKVPESVEVSSHGSNVVFSMQGRRLSSFPPLEVTSSSELTVPDFDAEYSLDGDDTIANKNKGNTTPRANAVFQVNNKQNGGLDVEKPSARRRNVRFSDKNDVHEIAARETMTSPDSPATINNITSTINKINGIKQQYQQSTTATTPSTISNINNTNSNNKNTNITPPSTSLRRIFPTLTLPPLSETAALKTAQEQDLVHQLFPELFAANFNKSTKKKTNAGYNYPPYSPARPPSSPNPFTITSRKPSKANSTITTTNRSNTYSKSAVYYEKSRSKSVTPVPGKQTLSEFDKYLQNLKNRRAKTETKKADAPKKTASRRLKKTSKTPVNVVTKSLVDITNDPKLTNMRPIVLVERLSESVYQAKMYRQLNLMSECDAPRKSMHAMGKESRPDDLVRPVVSTVECLVKTPGKHVQTVDQVGKVAVVRSETKSLSDILTDVVEQEIIAPICKEKSSPLHDIDATLAVLESEDARMRNAERQVESLTTVVPVRPPVREEFEVKPQVLDTSKPELKQIKTEVETESEVQPSSGAFKKPLRNATSRTLVSSRIGNGSPPFLKKLKTPPPSPARIDVAGTSQGFLAGRLEADMTEKHVNYTDTDVQQRPLPNRNVSDGPEPSYKPTVEAPSPVRSKIVVSPKRQVKVRLKRFNFKDSEEYIIVSNTALDDFNQEQSEKYKQMEEAQDSIVGSPSETENEELPMERKRRVRRSTARKEKSLKKNVISPDNQRQSAEEENNLNPDLFNGTAGHNIESISTPPPTPPSPTENNAPANSDETSQQNSNLNVEPNNNHSTHSTFPPINTRPDSENMLSNYIASNSVIIQEFRRHVNMPPEVEIDTKSLSLFYKYLLERNDIIAMETVHRLMPLLKTKVFGSLASSAPQLRRKRVESCTLPSLILRRTRKFSSSEAGNESSWSEGTWSTMPRKRRKTICSDRQYLNRSPDFMHCKEIRSSTKPVDSPVVEVKGQQPTNNRGIQPIATVASPRSSEEDADGNIAAGTVQSPHHFSDSSSPALGYSLSSGSTPVQSEIYECTTSSASMRSICESPPDISRSVVVSRTYSKDNMVQHVFVPPEIEKCIEEQSSVACTETSHPPTPPAQPTTTKRQAACSANYLEDFTSQESNSDDDDDDDSKDKDYNYKAERKVIRSNKKGTSNKTTRRARCPTKTNTQRRKT